MYIVVFLIDQKKNIYMNNLITDRQHCQTD